MLHVVEFLLHFTKVHLQAESFLLEVIDLLGESSVGPVSVVNQLVLRVCNAAKLCVLLLRLEDDLIFSVELTLHLQLSLCETAVAADRITHFDIITVIGGGFF